MKSQRRWISNLSVISIAILLLSGCVARLPERTNLATEAIPALADGDARVYVYFGYSYMNHEFGTSKSRYRLGGRDGKIYINDQYVSYINDDAIIIDLTPGKYLIHWEQYEARDKDNHVQVPYELTVQAGDLKYLEANIRDARTVGHESTALAVLGGGVATGLAAYATARFHDDIEEEPLEGPQALTTMDIAEYFHMQTLNLPAISSDKINVPATYSLTVTQPINDSRRTPLGSSLESRLASLKNMYDRGLITQEQYDAKSKDLLDEL